MKATVVFSLLFVAATRSQTYTCTVDVSTPAPNAPPLPNVASQFTTRIEGNIENKGYTVDTVEYYDEPNNRGRLDLSGGRFSTPLTRIYTYADNQWFSINGTKCTAHHLSPNDTFRGIPVTFDAAGHAHIRGVADLLRFGKQYNETYMGQEEVRGIKADRWRSCTTRPGFNMSLDWYFAAADWKITSNGTPLRLIVEGVAPNRTDPTANVSGFHYFKHSYEFVFFKPGQADNLLFQIPRGIFCDGNQLAKNIPPLPNQFSARIQIIDVANNSISSINEVYDIQRQQFLFQTSQNISIQDLRVGIGFFLTAGYCYTYPLSPSILQRPGAANVFQLSPDRQHLQLRPLRYLLGLAEQFNVSYVGVRTVNDISCDVYQEERIDYPQPGNITIVELSYSRKSVTYYNHSNIPLHQIPVKYEVYSKELQGRLLETPSQGAFHQIYNIYDFEPTPHRLHNVDIGQCFNSSVDVWFQLDGKLNNSRQHNRNTLIRACTDSVAAAAKVDIIRVSRVTVIPTRDTIVVHAVLLGPLRNASVTPYRSMGAALDDAVMNLNQTIVSGQLKVSPSTNTSYSSVKGSLTTRFQSQQPSSSQCPTSVPPSKAADTVIPTKSVSATTSSPSSSSPSSSSRDSGKRSSSGYSAGAMAGLGIAMLIVGAAIGCFVAFLVMKRRSKFNGQFNYDKHGNGN